MKIRKYRFPQPRLLTTLGEKPNIAGKGENAGHQHFYLFPQFFPPYQRQQIRYLTTFTLSSANASNLDRSKILSFGK